MRDLLPPFRNILILVELQLAHWHLWTARSRRVGCGSMAASVIGLWHFGRYDS